MYLYTACPQSLSFFPLNLNLVSSLFTRAFNLAQSTGYYKKAQAQIHIYALNPLISYLIQYTDDVIAAIVGYFLLLALERVFHVGALLFSLRSCFECMRFSRRCALFSQRSVCLLAITQFHHRIKAPLWYCVCSAVC